MELRAKAELYPKIKDLAFHLTVECEVLSRFDQGYLGLVRIPSI